MNRVGARLVAGAVTTVAGAVTVAGAMTLLTAATARADDAPGATAAPGAVPSPPPQHDWIGKGQAGYLDSQGNTDAQSVNAALDVLRYDGNWKNEISLAALYGKSAGILSAERWQVNEQTSYNFTPRFFSFGGLNFEHDEFDGFVYQGSLTGGAGYKFIDSKTTQLTAQIGAGFRRLQTEQVIKDATGAVYQRIKGDTEGEAIGTVGIDFMHQFSPTTTLTDKFLTQTGKSNTSSQNVLALAVKMTNKLALSVGYSVFDNTRPAAGLKRVDRTTTLNLVFAFK